MSHWRSRRPERASRAETAIGLAPLIWLAAAAALPSGLSRAETEAMGIPRTSIGPATPEEAKLLWEDAQADYRAGRYAEAIPKLQRFLARHPGRPGYLEARLLLARSYIGTGQPHKAKRPLKDYILSRANSAGAAEARADLARLHLALGEDSEALLLAEELLKRAPKADRPARAQALVLKGQAQLGLKQESRAHSTLESARETMPVPPPPALQAELLDTELDLKLRRCGKFPSADRLDEGQTRDQLSRRGTCLLESLLTYRGVMNTGHLPSGRESTTRLARAYRDFHHDCSHPPRPPKADGKERSPRELESYFREMGLVLKQDCLRKTQQGIDLLKSWSLDSAAAELQKVSDKVLGR